MTRRPQKQVVKDLCDINPRDMGESETVTTGELIKRLEAYLTTRNSMSGMATSIHTVNDVPLMESDLDQAIAALREKEEMEGALRSALLIASGIRNFCQNPHSRSCDIYPDDCPMNNGEWWEDAHEEVYQAARKALKE